MRSFSGSWRRVLLAAVLGASLIGGCGGGAGGAQLSAAGRSRLIADIAAARTAASGHRPARVRRALAAFDRHVASLRHSGELTSVVAEELTRQARAAAGIAGTAAAPTATTTTSPDTAPPATASGPQPAPTVPAPATPTPTASAPATPGGAKPPHPAKPHPAHPVPPGHDKPGKDKGHGKGHGKHGDD